MLSLSGSMFLLLSVCIGHAQASGSCSYIYKVPRASVGAQCDAKGGIDADLLDRVWALQGGLQGIKLIGKANVDVLKNFQTQMRQIQQQYGQYSNMLGNLRRQIDDLKMILNAVPDEPGIDEVDDSPDSRAKRAVDPNKALRSALSMAEWKLINVTMILHSTMKKREQLETKLEKRIKDQEAKVKTILSKITNIENSLATIPAAAPLVGKPLSSAAQQEIANLTNKVVDLLVDVNVMTRLSGNRASDLTKEIGKLATPLSSQDKTLRDLKNLTSGMNSTFTRIDADVQDVLNTVVNATQVIDPLYQQLRVDEITMFSKYGKIMTDYNSVMSKANQADLQFQKNKGDLGNINATVSDLSKSYATMESLYKKFQTDYKKLSQYPVLRIGSVDFYAHAALKKQNASIAQLSQMVHVIEKQVSGLNKTILQTSSASG